MKKQTATSYSNVNVLPFKKRENEITSNSEKIPGGSFADLADNLTERIGRIESELQDSMKELESDVERLAHHHGHSKEVKEEIQNLATLLETRINASLESLIDRSKAKNDSGELKLAQSLSSQLIRFLSTDFYKGILAKLGNDNEPSEVDEFGMDPVMVKKIKPLFDFLYYKFWRVETTGIQNIPDHGRSLIVANHSGTLPYDGSMLAAAIMNEHPTRKDARYLVENFVYHMPILGTLMYRIGGVRACPENAERLLSKEHLVIVFPEGVKGIGKYYTNRYKLQRFGRGGFIKLCIKTQSPLIPVGIVGAEEIHPIVYKSNMLAKTIGLPYIPITPTFPLLGPLGMIPFPTKWYIHFGTPMTFEKYSEEALENEILVHELSEQVRNEIQKILIGLLKQRRSIWA